MRKRRHSILLLAALTLASASTAPAQSLPVQVELRDLPTGRLGVRDALDNTLDDALSAARRLEIDRLLRSHRDVLDRDREGSPVVRSEIVAIDPSPESLQRARDAGFTVARDGGLDELGLRVVVLRARAGVATRTALRRLRRLDPDGEYDYNHLYFGSAAAAATASAPPGAIPAAAAPLRVGLVDSGIDGGHPAFAGVKLQSWGCGGLAKPDKHGTAVASLLVGDAGDRPATTLFAADIYCGQPAGGAVTGLASAMAWLARERVDVVNLSLVGPPNRLLERVIRAMAGCGHVLVAAVGNDGPAAPPLYPAAYPGVIGVTAVDTKLRVLPEAGRGAQVDFAAAGAGLRVAVPGGGWDIARGTSFAAPWVARLAAQILPTAGAGAGRADEVRTALASLASDLGPRGRDDTYGHGLLATSPGPARTDASR